MASSDSDPGRLHPARREVLRASPDAFAVAFDHSPLALTITSLEDGRLVEVNEAFLRASGYTREEAIGRTPDELRLWVEPEQRQTRFERLMDGAPVPQIEARFRVKTGEIRFGLIGSALVDIGGRKCVLSTVLDITERKRAEERLREREDRDALVLAGADAAIWDWHVPQRRVDYSPRWKHLRGLRDDEVSDSEEEWRKGIHPDDVDRVMRGVADHFEGRTPVFAAEYRVRRADGRWIWISDRGVARRDPEGRVVRMAGSEIEITDRKLAEEALRASEARYRAIVEGQAEMICRFRPDGEILFVNGAYARARGTTPDALTGGNFWQFVEAEDRAAVQTLLDRLSPEAPEIAIENRFETADGVRWTLWTNRALEFDERGRPVELQSAGIDITGRKAAEEKLRESEAQLRKASQVKDDFLATLSHELRTPLNAVLGWAHMLRIRALSPEDTARAHEALERNALAQAQLVDELLDMSRIASGKLPMRDEPVDLAAVASAAEETLRPVASDKGVTLRVDIPEGAGHRVRGDADRLQQVLWNLLSNGIKFTPAGGDVHLRLEADGAQAVITVRDTGEGIDPAFLPQLFQRFSQADSSTTRHHSGLGLGLAIARHLVEAHGGSISGQSEGPGTGAVFTVRLPLMPAD